MSDIAQTNRWTKLTNFLVNELGMDMTNLRGFDELEAVRSYAAMVYDEQHVAWAKARFETYSPGKQEALLGAAIQVLKANRSELRPYAPLVAQALGISEEAARILLVELENRGRIEWNFDRTQCIIKRGVEYGK